MPTVAGWLARNDFRATDRVEASMFNNLANDIHNWGGDVNGGAHRLSNVILDGSGGFQYYLSPLTVTPGTDGQSVGQYSAPGVLPTDPPLTRWTVGKNNTPETGGNNGSDFDITRFADDGTPLGTSIRIYRTNGLVSIGTQNWFGPVDGGGQTLSNVVLGAGIALPADVVRTTGSYPDPGWIPSYGWGKITGKPATFPPSAHTHPGTDITSIVPPAYLGSGTANSGTFLRGDGQWAAPPASGHTIQDEGGALTQRAVLNFVGAGVTASDIAGVTTVTIPGAAGGGYSLIQDEGIAVTQRSTLNFVGAGVTASDVGGVTTVTIPGGAGGSNFWLDGGGGNIYYSGGAVGIGTASPVASLDVAVSLSAQGTYEHQRWTGSAANMLKLQTVWDANGIRQQFIQRSGGADYTSLSFASGNVGIGTGSPTYRLTVASGYALGKISIGGESDYLDRIKSTTHFWFESGGGTDLIFAPAGTERVRFRNDGTVGIGTSGPSYTTHIVSYTGGTPSLTYHSAAWFGLDCFNNVELVTSWLGASPWSIWMQARSASSGAVPLCLNPAGGAVGIGTTVPTALLTLNPYGLPAPINGLGSHTSIFISGSAATSDTVVNNAIRVGVNHDQDYGAYFGSQYPASASVGWMIGSRLAGVDYPMICGRDILVAIGNPGTVPPFTQPTGYWCLNVGPTSGSGAGILSMCANVSVTSGQPVGGFSFSNYNLSGADKRVADVNCMVDGGAGMGAFMFRTAPSAGNLLPCVWIGANQNVRIGSSMTDTSYKLEVNGDINCTGTYRLNGNSFGNGISVQTMPGRTLGQVVTNNFTGGKPLMVVVTGLANATQGIAGYCDPTNATTVVVQQSNGSSAQAYVSVTFWVPPGWLYKVTMGAGSLYAWIEYY